jgi:hypothetical protein
MKAVTRQQQNHFLNSLFNKPLNLCQEKLKSSSFVSRYLSGDSLRTIISLAVPQEMAGGLAVFLEHALNNKRNLVGNILLVVGFSGMFLHQIFSHYPTPDELDTTWFFLHPYFFLLDMRLPFILIMWSASFLLLSPAKYKYAVVPFSLVNSVGWLMLIHRILFTTARGLDVKDTARWAQLNLEFNAIPAWQLFVMALSLGTSIILSLDYLLYRYNHTIRGNHTRLVGIVESSIPAEQKEQIGKELAKEFRNLNAII